MKLLNNTELKSLGYKTEDNSNIDDVEWEEVIEKDKKPNIFKSILKGIVFYIYMISSLCILVYAMAIPISLSYTDRPPDWTFWVAGILALIIMPTQGLMIKWGDKIMKELGH